MVSIGLHMAFSFCWYHLGSNYSPKASLLHMNFDPTQLIKFAFVKYLGDLKGRGLCSLSSPKMKQNELNGHSRYGQIQMIIACNFKK